MEYRAGFYQCSDCGVSLVPERPQTAPHDLGAAAGEIVVFESAISGEAEMVAGALEEAGIPSTVRRSVAGGLQLGHLDGGLTPGQSLSVSVPLVAQDKARSLIADLRPPDLSEAAPLGIDGNEALATGVPARGKAVARVVLAIIFIPAALFILNAIVALVTGGLR